MSFAQSEASSQPLEGADDGELRISEDSATPVHHEGKLDDGDGKEQPDFVENPLPGRRRGPRASTVDGEPLPGASPKDLAMQLFIAVTDEAEDVAEDTVTDILCVCTPLGGLPAVAPCLSTLTLAVRAEREAAPEPRAGETDTERARCPSLRRLEGCGSCEPFSTPAWM